MNALLRRRAKATLLGGLLALASSARADSVAVGIAAGIDWVGLPGGDFMMGAEDIGDRTTAPAHRVSVRPFEMARTSVTGKQYAACVAAGKCEPIETADCAGWTDDSRPDDDRPVVCATWFQASEFAEFAGGRLPSEAEREYAARSAGQDRRFPWGDDEPNCDRAVLRGCVSGTGPMAVCSAPAGKTDQGLCDMAGNVDEWIEDTWHNCYLDAPSDGGPWEEATTEGDRVIRGGSWGGNPDDVRASSRLSADPHTRSAYIGFRPVRSVSPTATAFR